MLAFGLYKILKFSEYETTNPGQDFNDQEEKMFDAPDDPVTADDVARPNPTAIHAEQAMAQATQEIVRNLSNSRSSLSETGRYSSVEDKVQS